MSVLEDLEPEADGRTLRIRPADLVESELVEQALAEGEHRIELSVGRMFLGDATFTLELRRRQHRPRRSTCPPACRRCRSTSPSRSRARSRRTWSCRLDDQPIDNDDGSFAVDFDSPPTGSLAFEAIDEAGNRTAKHVVVPGRLPGDVARRARERGGVGRRRAARRHRGPDRPRPDRHRRARPQGRVRDRRLRLRAAPRPRRSAPSRADYDLSETVDYLEEQGRPGDRPARRVPRPDLRAGGVGRRRPRPGRSRRPTAACSPPTAGSPTSPTRRCGRTTAAIALEAESMGVKDILWDYIRRPEGDPDVDGGPRAGGSELRVGRRRSSPRCSASCGRGAPTRGRRCSASPRRPATASPRTCRRWAPWSTTWRRWSTRRTGARACTGSTARSASPTTS